MVFKLLILPGQYSARDTALHRLNTSLKLGLLLLLSLYTVVVPRFMPLLFLCGGVLVPAFLSLRIQLKFIMRTVLSISFLIFLIFLLNVLSIGGEGLYAAGLLSFKLLILLMLSTLFTLCTMPVKFVSSIVPLLKPLKVLRIKPGEVAFVVLYALRFVPMVYDVIVNTLFQMKQRQLPLFKHFHLFFKGVIVNIGRYTEQLADALTVRGINFEGVQKGFIKEDFKLQDIIVAFYTVIILSAGWVL